MEDGHDIAVAVNSCFSLYNRERNLADEIKEGLNFGGPDKNISLINAILKVASSLERIAVAAESLSGIEVKDA